ncbi:MAG: MTAP family purine nucleoside phosphorylase [Syntrophorhabdaceae bacterium]|nr:MTAP family purine nucleoside phosphorylase [Syntrophorhabdaceae bacterium]
MLYSNELIASMRAIIGGSSLFHSHIFDGWNEKRVKTPYGDVLIKIKNNRAFIQRHGSPPVAAHMINHRANIWALKKIKTEMVISINSVGSLKLRLKPGCFVVPHDFISFWDIPTFYEYEMKNIVPVMNEGVRDFIIKTAEELNFFYVKNGVYIQTKGPRFETKAEINILKRFGDVVGMTMASEATLSMEADIPYASLCSIDNYCNGIAKTPLTMEELEKNWKKNLKHIERFIEKIIG